MPAEGYTTATITAKATAKLAEVSALSAELGSLDEAIEHAIDLAGADHGTVTNATLA